MRVCSIDCINIHNLKANQSEFFISDKRNLIKIYGELEYYRYLTQINILQFEVIKDRIRINKIEIIEIIRNILTRKYYFLCMFYKLYSCDLNILNHIKIVDDELYLYDKRFIEYFSDKTISDNFSFEYILSREAEFIKWFKDIKIDKHKNHIICHAIEYDRELVAYILYEMYLVSPNAYFRFYSFRGFSFSFETEHDITAKEKEILNNAIKKYNLWLSKIKSYKCPIKNEFTEVIR